MRARHLVVAAVACALAAFLLYRHSTDDLGTASTAGYSPTRPAAASRSDLGKPPSPAIVPTQGSANTFAANDPRPGRESPQSQRSMALSFIAPESVRAGERFSVRVVANADAPVGRYALTLSFDPSMLRAVSASAGNFMEQGSALAKFTQTPAGQGEIVFGAEQDGGAGVEGTGTVAIVEFEASAPGTASIALKAAEAFQGNGDAVRVTTDERRLLMIAR